MLNNVNGFNYPDFLRNIPIINKDRLPKYPFGFLGLNGSDNNPETVQDYQAGGNREVEEFKKMLAESNSKKTETNNIITSCKKDILSKVKLNLPFASFWGIED